jgi:hydrogenase-4 component B
VVGALTIAGAGLLGAGTLAPALRLTARTALPLQALGVVLAGLGGALSLFRDDEAGGAFRSAIDPAFGVDPLSGFFLFSLAVVAAPAAVFARGYLAGRAEARAVAALGGAFLLALVGVVCARDATTFLVFWELMTLAPAAAILAGRNDRRVRRDVFAYVAITHLGGVGVWLALIALQQAGALGDGTALAGREGLQTFVAVAAVVGFGTKAGLMPAHTWLPRAHPVAPSHVSALMSGMMIKVALYGLVRVTFEWLGATPLWLGALLLALGGLSALGGVLYALFQHDLKRLLAFHSIENVGIIVLALGASLVFAARDEPVWAAIAFAAGLLHTLNHAVFKALLFLGAGAFERAVHGLELDRLGGLLRRMPWTGGAFLVGAMAIAGLPPLNGFASEWLTLQSLLHLGTSDALGVSLGGLLATAALGVTAALAVFCFVKVVGLVLLGRPRRPACATAVEAGWSMRAGVLWLAGLCVVLGAVPGLLLPYLLSLSPFGVSAPVGDTGLDIPATGTLGTLAVAILVAVLVALLAVTRRGRSAAPAPHWACGQLVEPALDWTSAGFTKPLRLILEVALRPERTIAVRREHGLVQSVSYEGAVPHLFETALYRPLVRASLAGATRARRLQSGSLRLYVATLVVLVVLVLALARSGALG